MRLILLPKKITMRSLNRYLIKAKIAYNGKNTDGFRKFITHRNKYGFSSLESAASADYHRIAELVISEARSAFGDDKIGFREFIND